MWRGFFLSAIMATSCYAAGAQKPAWEPEPGHLTLPLWPNGVPGADASTAASPEVDTTTAKDNLIAGKPLVRLGNVSTPTITVYKPKSSNGPAPAIVVFPGGGYQILAIDLEGTEVCEWLNSAGIACVLLKYRVPNSGPYPKSPAALQDAQRAMGMVRQHATEWGIDSHRLGVLGFSAGGHLAAALSTHFDKRIYDPVDAADQLSCRPDFAVVIYPGYLALADQNMAPNPGDQAHRRDPAHVYRPGRGRPGARRECHQLLPGIEKCQGSRRTAHLCRGRPRLWVAPHRASRHHLAVAG